MHPAKRLKLILLQPTVPQRVKLGAELTVVVQIVASGLADCRLDLRYDHEVLALAADQSDHREMAVGEVAGNASWRLSVVSHRVQTHITVEASGGGLTQHAEIPVEVLK